MGASSDIPEGTFDNEPRYEREGRATWWLMVIFGLLGLALLLAAFCYKGFDVLHGGPLG